jgi:hypothetical protein
LFTVSLPQCKQAYALFLGRTLYQAQKWAPDKRSGWLSFTQT